jgi:hypothetical protein
VNRHDVSIEFYPRTQKFTDQPCIALDVLGHLWDPESAFAIRERSERNDLICGEMIQSGARSEIVEQRRGNMLPDNLRRAAESAGPIRSEAAASGQIGE